MTAGLKTHHLNIGELIVSEGPIAISTVLGSCVSVCLYSATKPAGGMIHYALPRALQRYEPDEGLRYGEVAIPQLVRTLEKVTGEAASDFLAKITGGASEHLGNGMAQIGLDNIEIARRMLAEFGIPIMGEAVGGSLGRKAIFHVSGGRLQVATIKKTEIPVVSAPIVTPVPPISKPIGAPAAPRKVLIVDDSRTICELLKRIISEDPRLRVVGTAPNPIVAEKMIAQLKPDVLSLDIHMPEMDGVTFLEKYLPKNPLPVVMITSISLEDGGKVLRALELGAVDYIQKPTFSDLGTQKEVIRDKLYDGSFAKVSRRRAQIAVKTPVKAKQSITSSKEQIIAIGASTGGTEALKEVLTELPGDLPPILIVQHIPPVFSTAFAKRLNDLCELNVKEAVDGDPVLPGQVLLAPGDFHMELKKAAAGGYFVRVFQGEKVNRHRPAVDVLFDSVAALVGKNAIGVILTGMGADGARGLLKMREAGARTIAQDEHSSVVFGMPKEAIRMGAAEAVYPLDQIARHLLGVVARRRAA